MTISDTGCVALEGELAISSFGIAGQVLCGTGIDEIVIDGLFASIVRVGRPLCTAVGCLLEVTLLPARGIEELRGLSAGEDWREECEYWE